MKTIISLLATCAACVAGTTINTATVGTLNVGVSEGGGGDTYTLEQSHETADGLASGGYYFANLITSSSAYDLTKVSLHFSRNALDTSDYVVTIRPDNSTQPSATVLGTSDTVLNASVGTSADWVEFTFSTPVSLSSSTLYWIVLTKTGTTTGYAASVSRGNTTTENMQGSTDGSTWSSISATRSALHRMYSSP